MNRTLSTLSQTGNLKPETSLTTKTNAQRFIQVFIKMQIPFTLTCSNYTAHISNEVINRKFVHTMQSKRCFAAFAKVKSDVSKKMVPHIDPESLSYFQHDFRNTEVIPEVFNIDLKSAYATCLFNAGYISEPTFQYLAKITKNDRLAAVGMLASKKKIFDFDRSGKVFNYTENISPLQNFFFFAVKETAKIMDEIKRICGKDYLFTWVDGIYFRPNESIASDIMYYLETVNFKWSLDYLKDFDIKMLDSHIKISFLKDDKNKRFCIPSRTNEFKILATNAFMSIKKNKKNKNAVTAIADSRAKEYRENKAKNKALLLKTKNKNK